MQPKQTEQIQAEQIQAEQTQTEPTQTPPATRWFVGIDVAKAQLVVAAETSEWLQPTQSPVLSVPNTPAGFAQLQDWLIALGTVERIVLETSGGYEEAVRTFLLTAGWSVVRVNSVRARAFLKSQQGLLKTDARDARSLARFGKVVPEAGLTRSEVQEELRRVHARREQVRAMLEAERKRAQVVSPRVRPSVERMIEALEQELGWLDAQSEALVAQDAELQAQEQVLQSAPGVGRVVAQGLLAFLPELGRLGSRPLARLAGLAPVAQESGSSVRRRRRLREGRGAVRRLLYLAALSEVRVDGKWRRVYEGLLERGLSRKAALCAVARRLLCVLNAMVRDGRCYARMGWEGAGG